MIDQEKLQAIKTRLRGDEPLIDPLAGMDEIDLRRLRGAIDAVLPKDNIASLDLETELVSQYRKSKLLMDEVLVDGDTPANQKAQVANSLVTTLSQLFKMQEDLKREQTFKIMEEILVDTLKALPEEVRHEFYAEYERLATKAGLM